MSSSGEKNLSGRCKQLAAAILELPTIIRSHLLNITKAPQDVKPQSILSASSLTNQILLNVEYRINFKIANITFNTLHYSQPAYLHSLSLLCSHTPAHSLTSSNTNLLITPFTRISLGTGSFSVASPKV